MSLVSNIKPETESIKRLDDQTKFNDRTWQSYMKEGFIPNDHTVIARHDRLMKFLAEAGDRPIHRRVDRIYRIKSAETGFKEYIYYQETLTGTTWAGDECSPNVDHEFEGQYYEQIRSPRINEKKEVVEYVRSRQVRRFTIPYTKKALDEIIDRSEGSDRDSIKFHIDNPNGPQNSDSFRYDQFILPWNDCMNILLMPGGPQGYHAEQIMKNIATQQSS